VKPIRKIASYGGRSPRRLEAEEVRDSILAASGKLQSAHPGSSAAEKLKMIEMRDNGPEARNIHDRAGQPPHIEVSIFPCCEP
jgi:hypothetical protein